MRKWGVVVVALVLLASGACTGSEESGRRPGVTAPTGPSTSAQPRSSTPVQAAVSFELLAARAVHTASELSSGRVLVAGGCVTDGCGLATAETFIISSDGASVVRGPDLLGPRDGHTATVVSDGDVVLIGGYPGEGRPPLAAVEVFDADSGSIRLLGELSQPRGGHGSALLGGESILVVGGWIARRTFTASAEVVHVSAGSVARVEPLPVALHAMDAVSLADGRVLVTGGELEGGGVSDGAWIYDPESDSWSETGAMTEARSKHFSLLLPNATVLVIGGAGDDQAIHSSTEVYDPATGMFTAGPDLVEPRYKLRGGAVLLDGERVVVGGGGRTVEVIDLRLGSSAIVADLGSQGSFATTTGLGTDQVLVLGGYDQNIDLRRRARVISVT